MLKERDQIHQIGEDLLRDMNIVKENMETKEKIMAE